MSLAKIEGFKVMNYKVLKNITMGKLWNDQNERPLTDLVAVIGKNGVGKSTIFDAFGFLSDCLRLGVEQACDEKGRGGYGKLVSSGTNGPIEFEIYYRETTNERPITYELSIDIDKNERPFVKNERLRQRRKGQRTGRPFSFLELSNGKGFAWSGKESLEGEESSKISIELIDSKKLGISTLGTFKEHPRISKFRNFISNWYLSYFTPDAARSLPMAGAQRHLNIHGDNLGNVVQFMERDQKNKFNNILDNIAEKIPGINKIDTKPTDDGRLLLRFNDRGFKDPFFANQMSDGTLKVFAYLLLLEDPNPAPFICIEEPENGLYHKLLERLASEFREHTCLRKKKSQIFVTTHQPYFVDALKPEETWILEKEMDGFSSIRRADKNKLISSLVKEGFPLGSLWYSDYLDPR